MEKASLVSILHAFNLHIENWIIFILVSLKVIRLISVNCNSLPRAPTECQWHAFYSFVFFFYVGVQHVTQTNCFFSTLGSRFFSCVLVHSFQIIKKKFNLHIASVCECVLYSNELHLKSHIRRAVLYYFNKYLPENLGQWLISPVQNTSGHLL